MQTMKYIFPEAGNYPVTFCFYIINNQNIFAEWLFIFIFHNAIKY